MIDKRVFVGGMDTDTDDRLVAQGDYRRAVNLRITSSRGDNVGTAEVARGNELITSFLPSGRNKTIGVHRSEQRDSIIYFVWNSNNFHSIYEYNALSGTITTVLQNSILNFKEFSRITGTGDTEGLLLWTDDFNPPRRINIEKAILHTQSGGTNPLGYGIGLIQGSTLEREKYINAIKAQPINAPLIGFFTDPTRTTNRVRGKFLRFRYRYIYDDGDKSAWSEPSVLGYTSYDFLDGSNVFSGNLLSPDPTASSQLLNGISLTMDSSHETVVGYEVSVSSGDNDFFLWREFDKSELSLDDDVPFTVEYFGDSVLTPLEINDSISPFDDVPLKAKALALIEGNRVVYGNVSKGYDPVEIDVSLQPVLKDLPSEDEDIESDIDFGSVINLTQFSSEFITGGQVNNYPYILGGGTSDADFVWNGRRWGISAQEFKDLLIDSGVEVVANSFVEIEYGLGTFLDPYSGATTDLGNITLFIPDLTLTTYDDPYFYLYDALRDAYVVPYIGEYAEANLFTFGFDPAGFTSYTLVIDGTEQEEALFTVRNQMLNRLLSNGSNGFVQSGSVARMRFFDFINFSDTSVSTIPPFSAATWNNGRWPYEGTPALAFSRGVVSLRARCIPAGDFINTTFKSGSTHRFGIVYFDAYGRSGFANISENSEVYSPSITERNIEAGTNQKLITHVQWRINHLPPSWATHYAWVYAGNDRTDDFLWLPSWIPNTNDGNTVSFISPEGNNLRFSLKRLRQFQDGNVNSQISYDYSDGDRVSFLSFPSTTDALTNNWRQTDERIDVPIVDGSVNGQDYLITVPNFIPNATNANAPQYVNSIMEIYKERLNTSDDVRLYYTLSEKYPIVNGQHSVIEGEFTRGDAYFKKRGYQLPSSVVGSGSGDVRVVFWVESPLINDVIRSRFYDRGKAFTVDNRQGQARYIDQVTWSESLVIGSRINGLSKFNPVELPFKEYGRVYGAIQRLFAVDNRLEIYQEDKVQYSLVSRDVIYDNGGGASVLGTLSNVLSDAVAYAGEYGVSNNPESWAVFGNRRYFVDRKRGVVCRLSADGIEVISDNKMLSYFRDGLQNSLVTYFNGAVYGGYDARYSEYVVSIERRERTVGEVLFSNLQGTPPLISVVFDENNLPDLPVGGVWEFFYVGVDGNTYSFIVDPRFPIDITETDEGLVYSFRPMDRPSVQAQVGGEGWFLKTVAETLAFNENTKRWTTFYTYEPEFMMRVFNELCSFKNGRFYLHGNGSDCEFYGEVTPPELWVVSNAQPSLQKFFRAVSIEGDMLYVPYLIETPLGQRSELIATDFSLKEGFYYSELFRDLNTPSDTTEGETLPNALFEGDMLRDYAITLRMRGELGSGRELFAVNVVFEVSFLAAQEG